MCSAFNSVNILSNHIPPDCTATLDNTVILQIFGALKFRYRAIAERLVSFKFRCPWTLPWSLMYFFSFGRLFNSSETIDHRNKTTPKICKITVVLACGHPQSNGGSAHYAMVSKIQWKPFWLATQLYPENDRTGSQNGVNDDVCAQAPSNLLLPSLPWLCAHMVKTRRRIRRMRDTVVTVSVVNAATNGILEQCGTFPVTLSWEKKKSQWKYNVLYFFQNTISCFSHHVLSSVP